MGTFQPAINCAEITINCTVDGRPVQNTWTALFPGAYSQTDLDNLAELVDGYVAEAWLPVWSTATEYINTHVRGLTASIDLESTNDSSHGAGSADSDPTPNQVAFVISKETGHTGRSARGRIYIFGLGMNNLTDSRTISTASANGLLSVVAAMGAAINGGGWTSVVLSRQHGGVRPTDATTLPITEYTYKTLALATQRRRLGRAG